MNAKHRDNPWGLTPAEAKAMTAICKHGCHKLAAKDLCLSVKTINAHSSNAARKMDGLRTSLQRAFAWDRWQRSQAASEAQP